jgi:pimeloyl-ACP methyl ester carboxylesterase
MHALLTGSRFAVIENAGHLPPLEQPAATRDALLAWLTQT